MIHKALNIQEKQLLEGNTNLEDAQKKRTALSLELQWWHKQQAKATPGVIPTVVQLDPNVKVEHEKLCIPSDFDLMERTTLGLLEASICKMKLREGKANLAVAGICNALRHENLLLATKSQHTKEKDGKIDDYPSLHEKDMYQKDAAKSRELGDGKMTDSWIWSYGRLRGMSVSDKTEFLAQADRVHWFRTRAAMFRWIEEVEILEEEF
ncbi:hypothetical protein H1R20_g1114, partial [Candolleomyces eurysporus]